MPDPIITNNDNGSVVLESDPFGFEPGLIVFAGADTYVEGTLMARKLVADAIAVTADVGNTGDGTVTAASVIAGSDIPAVGDWNLECTGAVANGGVFKLEDPAGNVVATGLTMTVGAGAATVFEAAGMTFTITDGAVDFIVGDKFALAVAEDGKFYLYAAGGIGGEGVPSLVLTYEITATGAGNVSGRLLKKGKVIQERLVIDAVGTPGSGISAAIINSLEKYSITVQSSRELNILDNQ
jgi:hypothetical protein